MCKINLNQELNGIELSFESKPEQAILNAIKGQGFKWNGKKKIWYAKQTADRLTFAKSLGEVEQETSKPDLKGVLLEELKQTWGKSDHMVDYCVKETAYIVALGDGDITTIDKPRIETRFCFGYGMYGVSTEEDYQAAASMERHARTNEQYFIDENLKDINGTIEDLKNKDIHFFKYVNYCSSPDDSKLKGIMWCRLFQTPEYEPWRYSNMRGVKELTEEERKAMLTGYEEVKKGFVKRLNTYLKRYGLKKLTTWTYLVD